MNMMTTHVARPDRLVPIDLLRRFGRVEVEQAIEDMIALLDAADGDPDREDDDGLEHAGDEADVAWTEWLSRGRHKLYAGVAEAAVHDGRGWAYHEDSEDDDPREDDGEDCCRAYEDDATRFSVWRTMGYDEACGWFEEDAEDGAEMEASAAGLTLNLDASNDR